MSTRRGSSVLLIIAMVTALVPGVAVAGGAVAPLGAWAVKSVALPANDVVFDSTRDKILLTVRSEHRSLGNRLVEADPRTGAIGRHVWVGSEPKQISLTDDGTSAYIGLGGANRIVRVDLSTFEVTQSFSTGLDSKRGPRFVGDLEALPGRNDVVVATLQATGYSPGRLGIWAFKDGVLLPDHSDSSAARIEFVGPETLFGYQHGFYGGLRLEVDESGVRGVSSREYIGVKGSLVDLESAEGLVYLTDGSVIDPMTFARVGEMDVRLVRRHDPEYRLDHRAIRAAITPETGRATFLNEKSLFVFDTASDGLLDSRRFEALPSYPTALTATGDGFAVSSSLGLFLLGPNVVAGAVSVSGSSAGKLAGKFASEMPFAASELIYDTPRDRLYVSVPANSEYYPNQLLAVDPGTGAILKRIVLDSEAYALAVDGGGTHLYFTQRGIAQVRSINLASFQLSGSIDLGTPADLQIFDIEVRPGSIDTLAVSSRNPNLSEPTTVQMFQQGVPLPALSRTDVRQLEFLDSSTLLGSEPNSDRRLVTFNVNEHGVTQARADQGILDSGAEGWQVDFAVSAGKIYTPQGLVVDPATSDRAGQFGGAKSEGWETAPPGANIKIPSTSTMVAVPELGSAFFIGAGGLDEYDLTDYHYIGLTQFPMRSSGKAFVYAGAGRLALGGVGLTLFTPAKIPPPPHPVSTLVWGYNVFGQLGKGATSPVTAFHAASIGHNDVKQVASGFCHSVELKQDGTVWAWGYNVLGSVGDGTTVDRSVPTRVEGLNNVVQVSSGFFHNLAVKADGTVWAWGWNSFGQVGDGTMTQRNRPVQVRGLTNVKSVSAGAYHSLALKHDGSVWSWGWNAVNQLGDGTSTQRLQPVRVPNLANIAAISGGGYHNLANDAGGRVWAWGYNNVGQIGDGTTTNRSVPVLVPGLTGIRKVSAGYAHSVVLNDTRDGFSWGWNAHSQLGRGYTDDPYRPRPLSGDPVKLDDVSAGFLHNLAISNGKLVYWGWNGLGQLGAIFPGLDTIFSPHQAAFGGPMALTSVSAGGYHSLAAGRIDR